MSNRTVKSISYYVSYSDVIRSINGFYSINKSTINILASSTSLINEDCRVDGESLDKKSSINESTINLGKTNEVDNSLLQTAGDIGNVAFLLKNKNGADTKIPSITQTTFELAQYGNTFVKPSYGFMLPKGSRYRCYSQASEKDSATVYEAVYADMPNDTYAFPFTYLEYVNGQRIAELNTKQFVEFLDINTNAAIKQYNPTNGGNINNGNTSGNTNNNTNTGANNSTKVKCAAHTLLILLGLGYFGFIIAWHFVLKHKRFDFISYIVTGSYTLSIFLVVLFLKKCGADYVFTFLDLLFLTAGIWIFNFMDKYPNHCDKLDKVINWCINLYKKVKTWFVTKILKKGNQEQ